MIKAIDAMITAISSEAPDTVLPAAQLAHRLSEVMAKEEPLMTVAELALFFLLRFCFELLSQDKDARIKAHSFTEMVQ